MTPETTQILFIDLQPEILGNSKTNSPEKLTQSAVALARIGKLFGLPMLASLVRVGSGDVCLAPELAAELNGEKSMLRTMVSVFDDLPTAAAIEATNRHDLVICGVISEATVLLACRGAILRGHSVHVPVDACGGVTQRTEEAAFRRMEAFGVKTAATMTLGAVLAQDLASPKGGELMKILQPLMS
jgi:hypothetical protein